MILRRFARPLLASIFVYGGIDAFRNPQSKVPNADKLLSRLPIQVPGNANTEQLVRADAAAKIVAGTALGLGKFPRLASLVLAASLIPTTAAGHRFWEETDPAKKRMQQLQFAKNASILGGVLLAAVDTEGKPSVGWRARRTARHLKENAAASAHRAAALADNSPSVADRARSGAHSANAFAHSAGAVLVDKAHDAADAATQALPS
ncbi:MAG: DoxX family protein [Jatrophihabitans sp.]